MWKVVENVWSTMSALLVSARKVGSPRSSRSVPRGFEVGDDYRCVKLFVSMYGTRPAAGIWQRCYTRVLKVKKYSPHLHLHRRIFYHTSRRFMMFVRGDDFVSTGSGEELLVVGGGS